MATQSRSEWKQCYSRYPDEIFDRFGNRRATDPGPDGALQTVLPGAERVTHAALAQRRANAPLKPKAIQRPCDVGLFGEDADQLDLCEMFQDQPEDGL